MSNILYRANTVDFTTDGRNIEGIAVYWNRASRVTDDGGITFYSEQMAPDSAKKSLMERAAVPWPLGYFHQWSDQQRVNDDPLGTVRFRASSEGLIFHARAFPTSEGNDALAKVKAGEWGDVSIGFIPYQSAQVDGIVIRTEIALQELSLAPTGTGQHQGAKALVVRAKPSTTPRLDAINDRLRLGLDL